jgi:hypothetical protein
VRGKNLDRDLALQTRVSSAIDLPHSPTANGRENFIRTKSGAGWYRH